MTWEDILKNRRRNIKIPKRPKKEENNYLPTTPSINVDRVNRQENRKRLETLTRWVDSDREQFSEMKLRLQAMKKTFEELEEEHKEMYEEWAKFDDDYKDSNLTGKEVFEIEKENYIESFDNFIKQHEKKLSEIKELERKLGE